MLGLSPMPAKTPAGGHGDRHAGRRRLRGRDAPLPEPPAAVRDRQSLPAGPNQAGPAAAGRVLSSAAIPTRAARATRRPTSRTASGSPGTATSAWWSIRCSSARSRASTTAPIARAAGGGSRAATCPPGVECLNGIRGIDYLLGRPDVDPQRIAVTGISGGGAATFWIAGRRPARRGGRAGQRHGRPALLCDQPRDQRPLRLHVPLQHLPVAVDPHRRPGRPPPAAVHQQRSGPDLPHGRQRAGHQPAEAGLQPVRGQRPRRSLREHRRARLSPGHPPGGVSLHQHLPQGRSADRHRQRAGSGHRQGPGQALPDRARAACGSSPRIPTSRGTS